jgi:hypothetical protein
VRFFHVGRRWKERNRMENNAELADFAEFYHKLFGRRDC